MFNCKAMSTTDFSDRRGGDAPRTDAAPAYERLPEDQLFHLLQNGRRRAVLRVLRERGTLIEMRALADRVAALKNDTSVEELSQEERQRVSISLYQSHLPKLDDAGVVDYDREAETVERTPIAEQFDRYLDGGRGLVTDPSGTDDGTRERVRSAGRNVATGLGGAMLGAGIYSASPWLLVGAALLFATLAAV